MDGPIERFFLGILEKNGFGLTLRAARRRQLFVTALFGNRRTALFGKRRRRLVAAG